MPIVHGGYNRIIPSEPTTITRIAL